MPVTVVKAIAEFQCAGCEKSRHPGDWVFAGTRQRAFCSVACLLVNAGCESDDRRTYELVEAVASFAVAVMNATKQYDYSGPQRTEERRARQLLTIIGGKAMAYPELVEYIRPG